MILSDKHIETHIQNGTLRIDNMVSKSLQLQPSSVDLTLGPEVATFKYGKEIDAKDKNISSLVTYDKYADSLVINPNDFMLFSTNEHIEMPDFLVGKVEGRSSLGRLGLLIHSTAGYIDPGFKGQITLEMKNINQCPIKLYRNMRICQLVIYTLSSSASRPYGSREDSKYQNQEGPTASRIGRDFPESKENGFTD